MALSMATGIPSCAPSSNAGPISHLIREALLRFAGVKVAF
jgi:hypothetical protein